MAVLLPEALVGRGIVRPFQRDEKADYANATGRRLVLSNVGQVLGTPVGSIPWRRAFGSRLYLLRHRPDHPAFRSLARFFAAEALGRWERRVRVRSIDRLPTGKRGEFMMGCVVAVVLNQTVIVEAERVDFAVG
jgi:phage baseplate assembly protein W